jgi:hypothetical protein
VDFSGTGKPSDKKKELRINARPDALEKAAAPYSQGSKNPRATITVLRINLLILVL